MKASAIVCAVLAGTFGFSSLASAQSAWRHGDARQEQRPDRSGDRQVQREARRDDRRDDRRGWRSGDRNPQYNQPRYVQQQPRYEAPRYAYQQPSYRASHRFYRGGYLPHQYRQQVYYVNNWNAYQGLYAPPYGYQWMNVDGDFLLVALATGLIANALLQ